MYFGGSLSPMPFDLPVTMESDLFYLKNTSMRSEAIPPSALPG
jgi:hypothetical protein